MINGAVPRGLGMKVYLVGGAVRDALLGLSIEERDWVVVGADAEGMRNAGFEPVDAEFPVYRHPETGEEYALARREIKQGPGYRGFRVYAGPDVTLEEDLARRDLTINAIAKAEDGTLIDPFDGQEDLDAGLLRHVTPAFVEDPLRILRVARFASKLGRHGFRVAHGTHRLMCRMVETGATDELHAERFGRETLRAMATDQPWRYLEVLQSCGALAVLLPDLARVMRDAVAHGRVTDSPPVAALKRMVATTQDPERRLLAALWSAANSVERAECLVGGLRVGRRLSQALRRVAETYDLCERLGDGAEAAFAELVLGWQRLPTDQRDMLASACGAQFANPRFAQQIAVALHACDTVDIDQLRASGLAGGVLGAAIERARREAIEEAIRERALRNE